MSTETETRINLRAEAAEAWEIEQDKRKALKDAQNTEDHRRRLDALTIALKKVLDLTPDQVALDREAVTATVDGLTFSAPHTHGAGYLLLHGACSKCGGAIFDQVSNLTQLGMDLAFLDRAEQPGSPFQTYGHECPTTYPQWHGDAEEITYRPNPREIALLQALRAYMGDEGLI